MNLYRCYFRDTTGAPMGSESIPYQTDAGARRKAIEMLNRRCEIRHLEVWRGADLVFRLSRTALALRDI
jgi:hypothetical protein